MCFSDIPENRRAFPRPARYDAGALRAARRLIAALVQKDHRTPPLGSFLKIDRLPNGKSDVNNNGAVLHGLSRRQLRVPGRIVRRAGSDRAGAP